MRIAPVAPGCYFDSDDCVLVCHGFVSPLYTAEKHSPCYSCSYPDIAETNFYRCEPLNMYKGSFAVPFANPESEVVLCICSIFKPREHVL